MPRLETMLARALLLTVTALGAGLPVALASRGARADEPRRVELTWIADPSCPRGDAVVAAVERLVRGSPPKDVIVARAELAHEGSWQVRLETRSGDRVGRRTVEAASCEQLADATALILALMIDPSAALGEPAPGTPPPPTPVPAPPPTPAPRPAPPPPPAKPRLALPRSFLLVAVAAVGDVGTLPAPAAGVGASGGLIAGAYRFTSDIGYFPAQTGRLAARPTAGGDFTLITGALVACRSMLHVSRVSASLCLGGELDAVLAKGFGVSVPESGSARWGALLGGGLVEASLAGPVSAELRVAGIVPFARPPFYFDDLGTVYRPTAVGLRLGLGTTAHF